MNVLKRWHIPPRRVVLWYAVSALPLALVVALGAYLSYHYHTLSTQSQEQVDRAYEVLGEVDALFVAVQDVELAERDVLIDGDSDSLTTFQTALHSVVARQAPLHTDLANSASQLERLTRLEVAIAAKTTDLGETVALRQTHGFDAVRAHGRGAETLMEQVRNAATDLLVAERRLLVDRQQATRQHERKILFTGVCIAALSVTIRLLVAWLLARMRKTGTAVMDSIEVS